MSYSNKLSAHYLELAKASVSKECFAGEDVRFSSEYEALESELGKAQSMYESGQIDWLKIRENSENLLRTQSRDLRVGAWLTWALYQRESFQGLLAGLGLLHYLCENHWADVHPNKPRTRAAAINWLVPRLEQVLNENVAIKRAAAAVSPSGGTSGRPRRRVHRALGRRCAVAAADLPPLEKQGSARR
jgi:Uncharacterized protein conserved in bacteria